MTATAVRRLAILLTFVVLLTLPLWMSNAYYVNIVSQILFWAIFALGLNVLVGYAGLVSLGHAGLFSIAGYTAGLMLAAGYGHLVAGTAAIADDTVADRRSVRKAVLALQLDAASSFLP